MISKMAMDDIAQLRADGIDVPPREVVRLNALGLRVERGPESPDIYAAPRVAFVRGLTFNEPTLGGEMWMRDAQDAFNLNDAETFFALRVLTCVVPWRELPPATNVRAVQAAAKAVMDKLRGATYRQVANALDWCLYGNLPETDEEASTREDAGDGDANEPKELPPRFSPEYGLFYRGVAARIGTAEDIKGLTYSAMMYICDRAEKLETAGSFDAPDRKAEKNKAEGDYYRTLDEIRAAAETAKEAGTDDGGSAAADAPQEEGATE